MPEYKFTGEKCGCGQNLSGKKVELEGMKGPIPMGRCPDCGTAHPLAEIEPEPAELAPEAEAEEAEAKAKAEAEEAED